jgi:16S rRNA (adenine1518-N6/adenine1519-N6)-dimethyltransferase
MAHKDRSSPPLSPSETRSTLDALSHAPNKKLGQNFLVDGNIVRKSIEMADLRPGQPVVEIGAGLGTLSGAILQTGAELWAVEYDARLAQHLRATLLPHWPQCRLLQGDCTEHPLAGLPADRAETGYTITANLPYAVASPWMDAVLQGPLPRCMVLMLQKEAADRYIAPPGSKAFGAISIFLQSAFRVEGRHAVPAQCFHPRPKVDSVLLHLVRKERPLRFCPDARRWIRAIFTQRRKQLQHLCRHHPHPQATAWFDALVDQGVPPTVRPEALALEHWQQLPSFFAAAGGG